jgi:hypothetical protein
MTENTTKNMTLSKILGVFLSMSVALVLGCSKSGDGDHEGTTGGPVTPPGKPVLNNADPALNNGGTIIGNGGDNTLLTFTLYGLKGFDYWNQATNSLRSKYSQCADHLNSTENSDNRLTEVEWMSLLLERCGSEPLPRIKYFSSIDYALNVTKLFLAETLECETPKLCGRSWQSFPQDNKIYLSPSKWGQLSEREKIRDALLAFDSLVQNPQKELINEELEEKIYQLVFRVDFSMDIFRNFIDERGMKILDEGAQAFTQEKMISQMSLAMDCIRLVEKRFPSQLDVKAISLDNGDSDFRSSPNRAIIKFSFEPKRLDWGTYSSRYAVRTTEKKLLLGRSVSLQKCYNSVVSKGLKIPLLDALELNLPIPSSLLEVPVAGQSELNFEFINIAFKALDYLVQDQRKVAQRYERCLSDSPVVGHHICLPPILPKSSVDQVLDIFPLIQVQDVDQRLCTNEIQNCSEEDSVTAINQPSVRKIIIHRSKWKNLDPVAKIRLALHETLGISGLETNDYHISSFFAPLIYTEGFQVDFLADQLRTFLNARKIIPLDVGDYFEATQFQERAILLMDCLNLVELRFPGRLNIGMVSMKSGGYDSKFEIIEDVQGKLGLTYLSRDRMVPKFAELFDLGTRTLYLLENTTLQQCYNKVVALGLR